MAAAPQKEEASFNGFFYWLMVVEFGSFQFLGIVV